MEKKKSKIVIIIAVIIILILLAIILTVKLLDIRNNKEDTPTINANNIIEDETGNNVVNESIQNNIIDNNVNEIVENNTTENVIEQNNALGNSQQISKEEIDNETMKKEEDNKAKAINIVKENWGEDSKVYFSFDSIDSNGKYIVSVRNKTTTEALAWYVVDLKNGTFSIE